MNCHRGQLNDADIPSGSGLYREGAFLFRKTTHGSRLVLDSSRIEQSIDYMRHRSIARMELNQSLEFRTQDLSFLADCHFLQGFMILHHTIQDISAIHALSSLIDVDIQTYCKTKIEFARFPRLKHVRLFWRPRGDSVFQMDGIEELQLDYYKRDELKSLADSRRLARFTLTNSPVKDISAVSHCSSLRHLSLINMSKLTGLRDVGPLIQLEKLEVDGMPKLESLEPLARLRKLRTLYICNIGVIPSLAPLAELHNLETLYFWERTNIKDGDLTVLTKLPSLREVRFKNRRHYSHSNEQMRNVLGERNSG